MAAGRYEGTLREIIHAFKYEGRRSLANSLGGMVCDAGSVVLQGCDCVVPVPLHPWRRMTNEIKHLIDQMSDAERRAYLLESLFLNTVRYENDKLEAYMRKISK